MCQWGHLQYPVENRPIQIRIFLFNILKIVKELLSGRRAWVLPLIICVTKTGYWHCVFLEGFHRLISEGMRCTDRFASSCVTKKTSIYLKLNDPTVSTAPCWPAHILEMHWKDYSFSLGERKWFSLNVQTVWNHKGCADILMSSFLFHRKA